MADTYGFLEDYFKLESPGTPAYVFDLDEMHRRIRNVRELLGKRIVLCYAMKANPFLTGPMSEETSYFEVCSPGEFRICERLDIPMDRIVLSGVYKNPEDIRYVLETYGGKGVYTVESWRHLEILNETASKLGQKISVLIRVTSGNQFGMDEDDVRKIIADRENYQALHILGLQFYSGTQKRSFSQIQGELIHLDEFLKELESSTGFQAEELEYGPGFYVPYFKKDKAQGCETELLKDFRKTVDDLSFRGRIILEMGRFLAASCGYYLTSIVDKKVNQGQSYAIVDGGIHHLNYYGQTMAMKQPYCRQYTREGLEAEGEEELWNLCGSLCTVSDVIVKNFPLNKPQLYDILVFERVGAYSVTEGIYLFLSRPLPEIYFWSSREGIKLVREGLHTDKINSER